MTLLMSLQVIQEMFPLVKLNLYTFIELSPFGGSLLNLNKTYKFYSQ